MIESFRNFRRLGSILGCLILTGSIAFSHEGEDHGTPAATVGGLGPVALSEETKQELGIMTEEVDLRTIEEKTTAYGVVEAKPDAIFWASTRISGRAVAVNFNAGDTVRKGDVLAEVESRQVAERPIQVPLKSLIAGTVTERNISVGQPIDPNSVLFRVMHLETVNVRLDIYEADAARVKIGQRVRVYPESSSHFEGPVVRIGGAMNEMSRTLPVWIELRNPETKLRPGMRVRAELVVGVSSDVVAVPRASVLGTSGNLFVFLDKGDYYVGQPVGVGRHDRDYFEITDGLLPGDLVVTRGAYQIQFAAAMSAPGGGTESGASGSDETAASGAEEAETNDALVVVAGVRLSDLAQRNLGLRTEEVAFRFLDLIVKCFGVFDAVPARVHHISTRIAGRVTGVHVAEGQVVRKGQIVAEIESLQIADPPPIIKARATISGVVIQRHVFAGEPVEPDKSLFTIANLDQLLVKCHVYEADLPALEVGQSARIYAEAFAGQVFEGRLEYFSGQIDPATRTLLAFVRVKNPVRQLRPNMRAEVRFITGHADETIAVPRSAVLHAKSGNPFVFVQSGDSFRRQAVALGAGNDRYYEILDGLLPGDSVVVEGMRGLEFATNSPVPPDPGAPPLLASVDPDATNEQHSDPAWWESLKFWKKSE